MAKRRKLKKSIRRIYDDLALSVIVLNLLSDAQKDEQLQDLLTQIMDASDEFVLRLVNIPGKNNPKLVKEYFRTFFSDVNKKNDSLEALIKAL